MMAPGAPPCENLRSFGSKCTVLKKVLVILLGLFAPHPQWFGARGVVPPCRPSLRPWFGRIVLSLPRTIVCIFRISFKVIDEMTEVRGRVLPAPKIQYGGDVRLLSVLVCSAASRVSLIWNEHAFRCPDPHASHPHPGRLGHEGEAVSLRHQDRRLGDRVLCASANVYGQYSAAVRC